MYDWKPPQTTTSEIHLESAQEHLIQTCCSVKNGRALSSKKCLLLPTHVDLASLYMRLNSHLLKQRHYYRRPDAYFTQAVRPKKMTFCCQKCLAAGIIIHQLALMRKMMEHIPHAKPCFFSYHWTFKIFRWETEYSMIHFSLINQWTFLPRWSCRGLMAILPHWNVKHSDEQLFWNKKKRANTSSCLWRNSAL